MKENLTKSATKLAIKVQFYLVLQIAFNIFCETLYEKTIFTSANSPAPLQFIILAIFSVSKVFFSFAN